MEEINKKLSVKYPKLAIEINSSPSYVGMYTKKREEVVLVCLKARQSYNDSNKNVFQEKEELDLTGSPLKLDLSLHTILDETLPSDEPQLWTKEEAFHMPTTLEQAREILIQYNQEIRLHDSKEVIPMWVVCSPNEEQRILLLMVHSDKDHFARGTVQFVGTMLLDDIDVDQLVDEYLRQESLTSDMVSVNIECKYSLLGISYGSICRTNDEFLNAPHGSNTELHCEWSTKTIHTPIITCKVNFTQEVIIGHNNSPCSSLWKSICALHNLNQLLVDMTVAGVGVVDLNTALVRRDTIGLKRPDNKKRLKQLLNDVETYAYMAQCPPGGCICITDDTTSLKQCLDTLETEGSSNDFTYRLWDILKDSETAEELIELLIQALKFISTGNIRPFIDANNKTYLSKLVLKLSRGHSQSSKVLKKLVENPAQALSLAAQVGVEKTMWEYSHIVSLLEHSFFVAGIWTSESRSHESIEQINQTIQDMTMSGGDFTLNPFESLSNTADLSIRLDCESFYDDDPNELSVVEFTSLKKHGLVGEKKVTNEVPLIADEIDITPWKNLLMKFAQVHVCLEHLCRAEICLRADFTNLKPLASKLLELYVSERSPVKTIGQLMSDPIQKINVPVANNIVKDHLKKPVSWYRVELSKKEDASDTEVRRERKVVYAFTQQPVFPPSIWQCLEPQNDEISEMTTVAEDLKYYCTKYIYCSNKIRNKLPL